MESIIAFFGVFAVIIVAVAIVLTVVKIRDVENILRKEEEKYKLRDSLEERTFSIVDILDIYEKDYNTYILIKDESDKALYMYLSLFDKYKWQDGQDGYLEPQYINYNKKEEVYLFNSTNEEAFPIEFNNTGGRYKLVEEFGHFEVRDDKLYIYKDSSDKPSIVKLNKIEHANKSYDINNIHNVKLIDCFIIYDKHSDEKLGE